MEKDKFSPYGRVKPEYAVKVKAVWKPWLRIPRRETFRTFDEGKARDTFREFAGKVLEIELSVTDLAGNREVLASAKQGDALAV